MEKKNNKKKSTTTKKTTIKKKTTKKVVNKKVNKKKKGLAFTLIELLAVIVILGILMLVAIPSVTNYINNSRKSAYINTAKQYIKGATQLVNSGELEVYDTGVTYYIPSTCIALETGGESPYGGKFEPAYIIVTYDNNSYNYYWMSRDGNSIGVKKPTLGDKLVVDIIETGIKDTEVLPTIGIDGRNKIVVFSEKCETANAPLPSETLINGSTGEALPTIIYPAGKDIDSVVKEDMVSIKDEQFYVVSNTDAELVLLAKYPINVGPYSEDRGAIGLQNENAADYVKFTTTKYWDGLIGTVYPGNPGSISINENDAYVYDSNSMVYPYVEAYKDYLISLGMNVKSARLLTIREANSLSVEARTTTKSFWLGNVSAGGNATDPTACVWVWSSARYYGRRVAADGTGVRPVIVVQK